MEIRAANKSDVECISKLVKSLSHHFLKEGNHDLPKWFISTLEESSFHEHIESTEYLNFVYEDNKLIIGYLSMKGYKHLYHLFVAQEYQGKGIAKMLWEHATTKCNKSSYTLCSSLNAVPFYKSLGFVALGEVKEKNGISFQEMKLKS